MKGAKRGAGVKGQQLEVALLIRDLKEAKKISKVFRKAGVIPYIFENLMDFWTGTLERIPSLCMIDVECMSDGTNSIVKHPFIKDEKMPICFYHANDSTPLLYSCYEIFHYGFVKKCVDYNGPVKDILRRYNRFFEMENDSKNLSKMNESLERQFLGYINKIENYKETIYYDKKLKSYCKEFEKSVRLHGLFEAVELVFAESSEVEQFSYYELSKNGQRLLAPPSISKKYRKLPSLWLGQMCPEGIEFFAQNMANEVVIDLMGSDVMCLMIKGNRKYPEKILFVKVSDEDFLTNFNWEFFENYLSGIYSRLELLNIEKNIEEDRVYTPWKLMTILDSYFFGKLDKRLDLDSDTTLMTKLQKDDDVFLIDLDFSSLVSMVREKLVTRFYFENFLNDFVSRMSFGKSIDYKIIPFGLNHLSFLVDKKYGNEFFSYIKTFSKKYPYWRYFEDRDAFLEENITPKLKMIPLSSEAYLRHIDGEEFSKSWNSERESFVEAPRLDN